MGLLQYDADLSLNRALISLWYRIPDETAAAARAQSWTTDNYDGMRNIVPLLTFGPQAVDLITQFASKGPVHLDGQFDPVLGFCNNAFDLADSFARNGRARRYNPPSFIGVKFTNDDPARDSTLALTVMTNAHGVQSSGEYFIATGAHHPCELPLCCNAEIDVDDISDTKQEPSLLFGNSNGSNIPSAVDHWHHLLVSWDVGTSESSNFAADSVLSDAKLYVTHDKVTYRGSDLPGDILDGVNTISAIGLAPNRGTFTASIGPIPSKPLNIPAPAKVLTDLGRNTAPVLKVEMAEMRIYTDFVVDTEDVVDIFVTPEGEPAKKKDIAEQFGRTPAIELTGTSRWRRGRNTGSSKIDLVKTGTIDRWRPDPSLFGPQFPKR